MSSVDKLESKRTELKSPLSVQTWRLESKWPYAGLESDASLSGTSIPQKDTKTVQFYYLQEKLSDHVQDKCAGYRSSLEGGEEREAEDMRRGIVSRRNSDEDESRWANWVEAPNVDTLEGRTSSNDA